MDQPSEPETSSKSSPSVRQPVSCEPCRKRKIRCSRTRPPCETCRRRRCPESCVYLGRKDASEPNSELLARVEHLETLLRRQLESPRLPLNSISQSLQGGQLSARDSGATPTSSREAIAEAECSPGLSFTDEPGAVCAVPHVDSSQTRPHVAGSLTADFSGNVRYETRGAQWSAVLANTGVTAPVVDDEHEGNWPDTEESSLFAGGRCSKQDLLAVLPPMQQCEYLKDIYFKVFSPLFHLLHEPTFHEQYGNFIHDSSSASFSWLAILFLTLALAVTSLSDDDPILRDLGRGSDASVNIQLLSKRYRQAAMQCLNKSGVFWGRHNLQSLQSLVMLGYAMSHNQEPIWVLLGMTYNVAIALACHIDPSNFDFNVIECEERRRSWAGLMMLYTIQNVFLGNPDPNRILNHSVLLPSDANDVDITINGVAASASGPTQTTYLLFKFQLYNLAASICSEVFSRHTISRQTISKFDQQICAAQESWDMRYSADSQTSAISAHHKMHLHILHAYAHQLFLLLHRPFFAQSILGLDTPNESQIRCIASAEALLDIHRLIHETPEYWPYLWYSNGLGSFHAFHASVVLAVALLMPIYKPQYTKFRYMLELALRRFQLSSGRSVICRRAAKVLQALLHTTTCENKGTQLYTSTIPLLSPPSEDSTNSPEGGVLATSRDEQLRFFADHLLPRQWVTPSAMPWDQWEDFFVLGEA